MKYSDMIDPKGKDNNNNSGNSNGNNNNNNNNNNNTITGLKRTVNILLFVLLLFLLLSAYVVRTSYGIANKNIQIQKELDLSRKENAELNSVSTINNHNHNNGGMLSFLNKQVNGNNNGNNNNNNIIIDKTPLEFPEYFTDHTQWKNHIHNITEHPQPWMMLREVNGLRNEDVVMIVASTGKNHGAYFRDRLVPSTRTWMKLLANVFIVIEDTHEVRFNLRHCIAKEYKSYTTLTCPHEATYILSRTCRDTYYVADGICCKVDDAINFITNENLQLFKHVKYLLQSDDDTFWRVDQLLRWLSAVHNALTEYGIADTIPLIGNPAKTPSPSKLAEEGGVWHIEGCKEIKTLGWYQPFMLNRIALERIKKSTKVYGITETCKNFDVSQDVGVGIFSWIHRLHHIYIPGLEINPMHKGEVIFRSKEMAVHGIRHNEEDDCEGKNWPKESKYDQQMITGCGKIDKPGPFHKPADGADMYDAWQWFAKHGEEIEFGSNGVNDWADVVKPNGDIIALPYIYPLKGYNTTRHFKDYDVTNDWQSFTLNDCKEKGKIVQSSRYLRRTKF